MERSATAGIQLKTGRVFKYYQAELRARPSTTTGMSSISNL